MSKVIFRVRNSENYKEIARRLLMTFEYDPAMVVPEDVDVYLVDKGISPDWLLTKAQEALIDRHITGKEMKFVRELIEQWEKENEK